MHCGCLVDIVLGAALFVDVTVFAVPVGLSIALVLLPVLLGLCGGSCLCCQLVAGGVDRTAVHVAVVRGVYDSYAAVTFGTAARFDVNHYSRLIF